MNVRPVLGVEELNRSADRRAARFNLGALSMTMTITGALFALLGAYCLRNSDDLNEERISLGEGLLIASGMMFYIALTAKACAEIRFGVN